MATTFVQDKAFYDSTIVNFGQKKSSNANGVLNYSGLYWPERAKNTIIYNDVEYAFKESRNMITRAYLKAAAALRNESAAVVLMERWFGVRNTGTGANDRDWWKGAIAIIGAVERFIRHDVNLYYRGSNNLIGQPNDYPGYTSNLDADDVDGFAESSTGVKDNEIGLCKDFFAKNSKHASKVNLKGKDSVGGTLIHELSHNICSTDDHMYRFNKCLELALNDPNKAFYNADNIQYFCEDAFYGSLGITSRPSIPNTSYNVARKKNLFTFGIAITYQDWITDTARDGHWRSRDLKKVDEALKSYLNNMPPNVSNLKRVFDQWYNRNPREVAKRNKNNWIGQLKTFLDSKR